MSAMLFYFCHDPLTISRERSNFPRALISSNKRPRLDLPTSRTLNFFTSEKRERYIFYVFCGKSERESESSTCFPCKKIASSDVIVARTICVPVACVMMMMMMNFIHVSMYLADANWGHNIKIK